VFILGICEGNVPQKSWLVVPHQTVGESRADRSVDGRYAVARECPVCVLLHRQTVFIDVRDREVVQSRRENITAEGNCIKLVYRPV